MLRRMSHFTPPTDRWLTIGALSQQSRLSLKALRLYHKLGLLAPARVDPFTGYRYYRPDQVRRARLIGLLRQLGMPLERIAPLLDAAPGEQVEAIRRYWRDIEGAMAVRVRLVAYLEHYLEEKGDKMHHVRTRHVPERHVLSVKASVRQPQLSEFLMSSMPSVAAALDATGVSHDTHAFVVYHGAVTEDSDGPVEVCMAFQGTVSAPAGMQVHTEAAHEDAYTTISKAQCEFPRILEAYDAVQAFVTRQGRETIAPPRDVYFVDINAVGPDDPFVDIAWPMAPASAK